MGKIFYLMGKSSSGKDSIYKRIREAFPKLRTVTIYTTRPIRAGETEGAEYHFTDEEGLKALEAAGKVIEKRVYNTVHGPWTYFTVDDGQFALDEADILMIGTLESYREMKRYFGEMCLVPLYIEVEDGERLARALARERQQEQPKYAELCRRFLADTEDFSEEKLMEAGVTVRYENQDMDDTVSKISETIRNHGEFML